MTITRDRPAAADSDARRALPLQNGDHLSRAEFERRFDATPNLKRAELIEGIVYMPPPVSHDGHGGPLFDVIAWLGAYRFATPGVLGGDNSSLRMDRDNMPQPDAFLMIAPERGGQARIDSEGYVEGAPELIFEVAASSASYDLFEKRDAYLRNRVQEYVVWRVLEHQIDWLVLRDGGYEPLRPGPDGVLRSAVFPGLWLDAAAMLGRDLATVAATAQLGIASKEHTAFVHSLTTREV